MKLKRKLASFVVAGIMAVMSCSSLTSSAYNYDANGDGKENISDAVYIMQYLCGCFEPTHPEFCDIDGNGVISPMDAYIIQLHVIGLLEVNDVE
ncbi:MAG: dockerin type I repeat-containing protein [Prevotella sp.]|nr:dockerin type I repeat-containing protein [Alistipes senegalensis]MCM1358708.1 dockerin type I repeat-containing protein [Prevotella sp.]